MLVHLPLLGELRLMNESSMRIEDRPCRCKDTEGLVCFECDDYAKAVEFAKSRNQVDADGNVRIGIADFQPRFLVTDENK